MCIRDSNDTYYQVKIDAAKLLLDNLDNTFTTPVFNGSTSLRDAAGQLIEDVTKAERRHQEVSEESIQQLYADTTALYHLDLSLIHIYSQAFFELRSMESSLPSQL